MNAADSQFSVIFRGVRGSYPMPGPTTIRYGGNTTCQEIRVGGRLLIFDAGTGIIGLGNDLLKEEGKKNIAIFFSHNHHDHVGGILYFKPAYLPSTVMHIFGPSDKPGSIMDTLDLISSSAAHPVRFANMGMKFDSSILGSGDTVIWEPGEDAPRSPRILKPGSAISPGAVVLRALKNELHPVEGVLNFRLEYGGKSFVYATDVEGDEENGDPRLAEFAKGADLLAHDGQYMSDEYFEKRRGWGHSTVRMAVKTAQMAGVKRLAIIHHEPSYGDDKLDAMEKEGKDLFPGLFFAREGQTVTL